MQAVKTGFVIRNKYSNEVEYEYKGRKYFVEYATGFNYCCVSPKLQHENKQAEIDRRIEEEKSPRQPIDKTKTCDYALDMFFKMLDE